MRKDAAKSNLRGRFRKFQEKQGRDFGGCSTVSEILSERERKSEIKRFLDTVLWIMTRNPFCYFE